MYTEVAQNAFCEVRGGAAAAVPGDAPLWFDALNGGVLYVLEAQALSDLGAVHTHAYLHRADP